MNDLISMQSLAYWMGAREFLCASLIFVAFLLLIVLWSFLFPDKNQSPEKITFFK